MQAKPSPAEQCDALPQLVQHALYHIVTYVVLTRAIQRSPVVKPEKSNAAPVL